MIKFLRVWMFYTNYAFQQTLSNRLLVLVFMSGKILRIFLFALFLFFIFQGTKGIGDYNREQIIFFYLTFNLIDTLGQVLYREVYRFRPLVVSGSLDFVSLKPVNPLVRILLGGADMMDLLMFIILLSVTIWYGVNFITRDFTSWILYFLMVLNGLVIATAFHILILGIGIITIAIDQLISLFRDMSSMLRIPVDLYTQPFKFLLTFIIPLGIMFTFPAKTLMGLVSPLSVLLLLIVSFMLLFLSLKFWQFSLKKYSSAGS